MTATETFKGWKPGILHVILLFSVLQLFVTLLTDGFVLSFDEAMWHYIGRNWFRYGFVPYAGGVDNKSPLIFAIFGLSDKLFGVNYWFPRVIGTICQSVGLYYVYKIGRHIANEHIAMLAVVFYGLALLWHATGGKYVSYTETYEVTFIIIAFYQFLTAESGKSFFISGLFAGLAFGFRITAIFVIVAILITSLRKGRINILMFIGGVISSIALLMLISFFSGIDLHNSFTYILADNFGSASPTDHDLAWKVHNFSAKFLFSGMVLFYPFVLVYFITKRKIDWLGLWLIFAFIGINAVGIYDVVHLKEILPALSIMSAIATAHLISNYKIPVRLAFLLIAILFMPRLSEPFSNLFFGNLNFSKVGYCQPPYRIADEGTRKRLGWWVRDNTKVQDKVLVAGFGAQVQVYSERLSPSIYFNVTQTEIAKQRFFRDMKLNKPAMILIPLFPDYKQNVSPDMRQFVDEMVAKDYNLETCMFSYNVYRIKK